MNIKRIIVGPLQTNCYLVWREGAGEAILTDPGAEADKIADACMKAGVSPRLAVNTHSHFDHTGANAGLKRRFPDLTIAVGTGDAASMACPHANLGAGFGMEEQVPEAELLLEDGTKIEAGGCSLRVLHTPGHSAGSISLISEAETPARVFCGDLIFADGVGRTDLPGGDAAQLWRSIENLLSLCSDETILYPGHGPSITAGERKRLFSSYE